MDDFEVMPRGTSKELKFTRQFCNDMIQLLNVIEDAEAKMRIMEMQRFYAQHVEEYPQSHNE